MSNQNAVTGHLTSFLQQAKQAFYWSSFNPERRGETTIQEHEELLNADLQYIPDTYKEKYIQKFKGYFSAWLSSQSRCASAAITGPSNFPTARMQKNYDREHNKYKEFMYWRKRIKSKIEASERKKNRGSELEEAKKNLLRRVEMQEFMKQINAIIRKHKGQRTCIDEIVKLYNVSEDYASRLLLPDSMGRIGFAQFELTNNLANIKRLQQRVKALKLKEAVKEKIVTGELSTPETIINGIKIISDFTDNRLKVEFDGKPAQNIINELKSKGFRWSPFLKCWCRKLTPQAKEVAINICNLVAA